MKRTFASTLTLASFLVACGGKSTPPPTAPLPDEEAKPVEEKPPADKEPAPPPEPKKEPVVVTLPPPTVSVKLGKAGKGKKTPLAYTFAVGPAGGLELAYSLEAEMGSPENKQTMPLMTFGYTAEVVEAGADGTYKLKLTLASADAKDQPGAQQPIGPMFTEAMQPIIGTTLETTLSKSGVLGERTYTSPPIADASLMGVLTSTPVITVALPDKPVGAGATWEVTGAFDMEGVTATMVTTYKLVSRKGNTATIEGKSTIKGDAQKQGDVEIKSIKGTGTSKIVLVEGKLLESAEASQNLEVAASQGGQDQVVKMATKIVASAK